MDGCTCLNGPIIIEFEYSNSSLKTALDLLWVRKWSLLRPPRFAPHFNLNLKKGTFIQVEFNLNKMLSCQQERVNIFYSWICVCFFVSKMSNKLDWRQIWMKLWSIYWTHIVGVSHVQDGRLREVIVAPPQWIWQWAKIRCGNIWEWHPRERSSGAETNTMLLLCYRLISQWNSLQQIISWGLSHCLISIIAGVVLHPIVVFPRRRGESERALICVW